MNRVKVRCWAVSQKIPGVARADELFITYPEDNSGHSLITCLSCGRLFAVTVAKEVYVGPPLEDKLLDATCPQCGRGLRGNWAYYPETYVVDGQAFSFERARVIPPDEESFVMEFDGVYE
jgi:hypothetical protein